jgi:TolA-binding protein
MKMKMEKFLMEVTKMKKMIVANLLVLAFLLGCGATMVAQNYVVPPAKAQNVQRWEYTCTQANTDFVDFSEMNSVLNQHGAQGWELAQIQSQMVCFKRAL